MIRRQMACPVVRNFLVPGALALAHRFAALLQQGEVADYATLARLGHVSHARVSQIMCLLQLAPDIQEDILFLERPERGKDPWHLRRLLPIAAHLDWGKQRRLWRKLRAAKAAASYRSAGADFSRRGTASRKETN